MKAAILSLALVGRVERSATRHSVGGGMAGYASLTRPTGRHADALLREGNSR
jgi:hypothetical protein